MQQRKNRKRKYAAPLGGIFIILAVVGVITVVIVAIALTWQMLDNTSEKEMFEEKIQPVVMFDPAPFDSPSDIPNDSLLRYCMWVTLSSERAQEYSYVGSDLLVPASELDVAARSLFGDAVTLTHETFTDYIVSYRYALDEEIETVNELGETQMVKVENAYLVTPGTEMYVFTPQVQEITKNGDYYSLLVHYLSPPNAWTTIFAGDRAGSYEKNMIYVMERVDGEWHIVRVTYPEGQGEEQGADIALEESTADDTPTSTPAASSTASSETPQPDGLSSAPVEVESSASSSSDTEESSSSESSDGDESSDEDQSGSDSSDGEETE